MDLSAIITEVMVFFISIVFVYVWNKYLYPYIQDKHLAEVANIVVHAAEAVWGSSHGQQKLAYAIKLVNEQFKINLDAEKIVMAIESAWKQMDIEQKS